MHTMERLRMLREIFGGVLENRIRNKRETIIDPFNPNLIQEQVATLDPFDQIVNGCAHDFALTGKDPLKNKNKVLRMAREVASDWLAS